MSQVWLLLAFAEPPGAAKMNPAKSGKCWWQRYGTRDAVKAVAAELRARNIPFKCRKVEAAAPAADTAEAKRQKPRFARRQTGGPVLQVIDGETDPKAAMIAAYRALEWQNEREAFTASAPQPKPTPLPIPKSPPLLKKPARSVNEELGGYRYPEAMREAQNLDKAGFRRARS